LDLTALGAYTKLIGDEEFNLPTTMTVGFDVAQRWDLDSVSTLSIPISPRYYGVDNDRDTISASVQAVYERHLSIRDTLSATLGITLEKEQGNDAKPLPRA